VESILANPKVIVAGIETVREDAKQATSHIVELETIEARLAELGKEQQQLLQWAIKGFPEATIAQENEGINNDRKRLKERKAEIEAKIESARLAEVNIDDIIKACSLVRDNLGDLSFENKRLALEALNIRILLGESKISIEGAIPVSYGSIESTPSNRKGERMPSISACQPTQAGQSMPLD